MTPLTLPPLNALRAFEAAARHLSFTRAGEELFVTHGAISKQIKSLETYLNISLFQRQHKQLCLTPEGERYLRHISSALQSISQSTQELISQPVLAQALSINVLPSLTINWLIPRLEEFKARHPHLYVDLSIGDFQVDFTQDKYDVAIRSATARPRHCHVLKLMDEDLCLVCSPQLAKQIHSLEDINQMTLLKHTTRPGLWALWADEVGLNLTTDKMLGMEHFYMLSQAAVSGMGLALIPRFFIEKELAEGSLVIPLSTSFISPYAYYVLTPKANERPLKAQAFIDWLLEIFAPYRHGSS
ncbi:transcriptional regulator GcvA [Shewanella sp.]|uniref:transcriptional regulator GcvA n=1 Tax=Shewanella sp. TaxID=50422 RepID=UPI003D1064E0